MTKRLTQRMASGSQRHKHMDRMATLAVAFGLCWLFDLDIKVQSDDLLSGRNSLCRAISRERQREVRSLSPSR